MNYCDLKNFLSESQCRFFVDKQSGCIHDVALTKDCPFFKVEHSDGGDIQLFPDFESSFAQIQNDFLACTDLLSALNKHRYEEDRLQTMIKDSSYCNYCFKRNDGTL